ncbi:hypothetical protein C1H46_013487 [Malus baccata]|uniref:Uncharacterized protein n=1 Tax=Malus baccata TaxID=106549 RepID=A0A540MQ86_MALBA|nr:hypothetical protein C1H46_013487 [Malus baccata]
MAAQLEQGYRQARESVNANNGLKVLLHLLHPCIYSPPAALDCLRALACRVLGLARDDTIAHILTKLQSEILDPDPRAAQPRLTRMVSVVEENWERSPRGSAQTKDYYNSQRRRSYERPSFDRSLAAEVDELKLGSNARVSPATSELFYGAKLLITEKELMSSMGSNPKSKPAEDDERAEESRGGVSIGSEPVCKNAASESTNGVDVDQQKPNRRHKKWSFWGLMQRRSEKKCVDEESADSWQKLRRVASGEEANASVSQKLIRSYSVSCQNQCKMVGLFSNVNGVGVENKCNEVKTLLRNKSARYSPINLDHGLLRFYLTLLRSYRSSESGRAGQATTHNLCRRMSCRCIRYVVKPNINVFSSFMRNTHFPPNMFFS